MAGSNVDGWPKNRKSGSNLDPGRLDHFLRSPRARPPVPATPPPVPVACVTVSAAAQRPHVGLKHRCGCSRVCCASIGGRDGLPRTWTDESVRPKLTPDGSTSRESWLRTEAHQKKKASVFTIAAISSKKKASPFTIASNLGWFFFQQAISAPPSCRASD